VGFDDAACERQAEPETTGGACSAAIDAEEWLEQTLEIFRRNSGSWRSRDLIDGADRCTLRGRNYRRKRQRLRKKRRRGLRCVQFGRSTQALMGALFSSPFRA